MYPLHVPYDGQITLRMLLSHTSGVPEYATDDFWLDTFASPSRVWTPTELVQAALLQPSTMPGTVYVYCNTNYILAGMIAEAASGESAAAAMGQRFFTPLGMHDTELAANGVIAGSYVHGYLQLPAGGSLTDVSGWNPSLAWTAGALVTSVRDMLRWDKALFSGGVLSANSLQAMITPVPPATNYGLGLGVTTAADGRIFIFHGGEIPGYSALIGHCVASDLTIFVLTNREDIWQSTYDIVTPIFNGSVALLP